MTFHRLGIVIPTDELIFFRAVGISPTSILLTILYSTNTNANTHTNTKY